MGVQSIAMGGGKKFLIKINLFLESSRRGRKPFPWAEKAHISVRKEILFKDPFNDFTYNGNDNIISEAHGAKRPLRNRWHYISIIKRKRFHKP